MKNKYYILIVFLLGFTGVSNAYADKPIVGSGRIKSETRQISGAKYLVSALPAKVILSTGSNEQVVVETDDNLLNLVNTYIKNEQLFITLANGNYKTKHMEVYVTLKDVNGIKNDGSGDISTKRVIRTDNLKLINHGSGDIKITNTVAKNVSIHVIGSGDITLGGYSDNINVEINSSGNVKAGSFKSKNTNIYISGSGDCDLFYSDSLLAKILGSGDVNLAKKPAQIKYIIKGSGDIIIK